MLLTHPAIDRFVVQVLLCFAALSQGVASAAPKTVSYSTVPSPIDAYDYVEVTATIESPDARNPFEDATLTGTLSTSDGSGHWEVEGFCDSTDGSVFRIRFMAPRPGSYKYMVAYHQGGFERSVSGTFQAVDGHKRGMLRIDPKYRWHFIWEGTGEHFFFNGTSTLAHGLAR